MPEVQEVFRMSTQKVRPDPGALERQHTRQRRSSIGKKLGAFVVAAAIGLAALVIILSTHPWRHAIPVNPPPTTAPADTTPVAIATNFLQTYGAFDSKAATGYLADDADIGSLIGTESVDASTNADKLQLLISFLEAQGFEQMVDPCEVTGASGTDTYVLCTFSFHMFRSNEIGRGPFDGSYYNLTVRDGKIVQASVAYDTERFSPQMWEPFLDWLRQTHPDDVAVMYEDETGTNYRLSPDSIRLWEQRTRGYVQSQMSDDLALAVSFMEARNAYDVQKAMSLIANDGASVLLTHDNDMIPDMPFNRLDRDELALAFEAERIYGVRYGSFECRPETIAWANTQITCSYLLDSRLRQIAGISPQGHSFGIGIRDGHITNFSFPWLNVGFPSNVPADGARFTQWLVGVHPDVGAPMDDGTMFYTQGQELTLRLTPRSIDLLRQYLGEYEGAAGV
jgi:hypothetical protein